MGDPRHWEMKEDVSIDIEKGLFVLAATFFMLFSASNSNAAIPSLERMALIALYNSTDGDNWKDNSGWKGNNNEPDGFSEIGSEDTWHGVVENSNHVTAITLSANQLSGSIPAELGNLSSLEYLALNGNQLTGSIPVTFGNLASISRIYLNDNQLSGGIPKELGNLSSLESLGLSDNSLWGCIPSSLGNFQSLNLLYLDHNSLSGEIPTDLMNLTNLNDGDSDFRYNHLYTPSIDLKNFLDLKQSGGDWESYQTYNTNIPHVEPMAVCGGYEPCFAVINEAITYIETPTVIFIAEGEYHENVTIGTGIQLGLGWKADFSCNPPHQPVIISGPVVQP